MAIDAAFSEGHIQISALDPPRGAVYTFGMNTVLPPALQPALSLAMHADESVLWAGKGELPGSHFLNNFRKLCGGVAFAAAVLFAIGTLYDHFIPLSDRADFLTFSLVIGGASAVLYLFLALIKSRSYYALTDAAAYIISPPLPFTSTAQAKRFPLRADLICAATIGSDGRGSLLFTRPSVQPLPTSPYVHPVAPEGFINIPNVVYVKQLIEEYTEK